MNESSIEAKPETHADMLTDLMGPLFKTFLAEKKPPALPLPFKVFEAAVVQTQLDKQ